MHDPPPDSARSTPDLVTLRNRLLQVAVKLVWNRADAEEIVQSAMELALTKGQPLLGENGAAWLYRTVCNLCLNHRRKRRFDAIAPDAIVSPSNGGSQMEQAEQLERLRDAIGELPDQQRLALTLRDLQKMEYEQVAEILRVSPATVRTHVRLARQALARRLGDG